MINAEDLKERKEFEKLEAVKELDEEKSKTVIRKDRPDQIE